MSYAGTTWVSVKNFTAIRGTVLEFRVASIDGPMGPTYYYVTDGIPDWCININLHKIKWVTLAVALQ